MIIKTKELNIGISKTINLGNYESIKYEIRKTVEITNVEHDLTIQQKIDFQKKSLEELDKNPDYIPLPLPPKQIIPFNETLLIDNIKEGLEVIISEWELEAKSR